MRHTFESLGCQSGFYLSHLFSSTRNPCSSSSSASSTTIAAIHPPPPLFNWPHHHQRPPLLPSATTSILSTPINFHNSSTLGLIPQPIDQTPHFLHNHPSDHSPPIMAAGGDHENDLKWPNGPSFFNALTGRTDQDAATNKLFLSPDSNSNPSASGFLSLNSQQGRKTDMFKRSFTLPARVASSSPATSSSSMDHHHHNQQQQEQQPVDYRNCEGGVYQDVMETFLE